MGNVTGSLKRTCSDSTQAIDLGLGKDDAKSEFSLELSASVGMALQRNWRSLCAIPR